MSEKKVFHNIIDGEVQAVRVRRDDGHHQPVDRRGLRDRAELRRRRTSTRPSRPPAEAFEKWRWTTPSERQRALLKLADVIEENADELVAIESENTGKPVSLTMSEEIPPMVDQIRFFAGAARVLEGKVAGRVHARASPRRSVASRSARSAQVAPWNYPMMMSVWKFAPALAAGQHRGAQAVRHDAGLVVLDGREDAGASSRRASATWSAATATPAPR